MENLLSYNPESPLNTKIKYKIKYKKLNTKILQKFLIILLDNTMLLVWVTQILYF